jgi:hypothetical protein
MDRRGFVHDDHTISSQANDCAVFKFTACNHKPSQTEAAPKAVAVHDLKPRIMRRFPHNDAKAAPTFRTAVL